MNGAIETVLYNIVVHLIQVSVKTGFIGGYMNGAIKTSFKTSLST